MNLFAVILPVPADAVNRYGRGRHRQLQTLARQAVHQAAARNGHPIERLDQEEGGRPLPWAGIHWSLSHKTRYVAGITAPAPVGIDLEWVRPMTAGMYARVGRSLDWDLLGERTPVSFFRLWTAKEAVIKAVGTGLRDLDRCILVEAGDDILVMALGETCWTVHQRAFDDHLAAVAAAGEYRVVWELPPSASDGGGIL